MAELGPILVDSGPSSVEFCRFRASGPSYVEFGRFRDKFGRHRTKFGLPNVGAIPGRIWPKLVELGPTSVEFGPIRDQIGRCWSRFSQMWSHLARLWPGFGAVSVKLDPDSAKICRLREVARPWFRNTYRATQRKPSSLRSKLRTPTRRSAPNPPGPPRRPSIRETPRCGRSSSTGWRRSSPR